MKTISPKIAVSAALILILCGCAQTGGQQNLPPAAGVLNFYRVVDSTDSGCIPQDFSADSGQTGEVVVCLEKSLAREEGARSTTLAELAHFFFALGETARKDKRGQRSRYWSLPSTIPTIVENLELARAIDQTYDQGGPLRVLGRIRYKAPSWPLSEGDLKQSLNLLRIAAKIAPDNSTNHLYLAETLIQLGEDPRLEIPCLLADRT